ncbi:hypothetical protein MKW94_009985 [Papaver nudicaule]|uniref:SCP domain-containing protein n=1 Tax=Papaver nudicaule TaxID=74823 RepID=A0AA41UZI3_PAPNU|nr:hypothetical protein [Papaver nudicaule]
MEIKIFLSLLITCSFLLISCLLPTCSTLPVPSALPVASSSIVSSLRVSYTSRKVIAQYLVPHNRARVKLGLHPLRWSEDLAAFAKKWVKKRRGDCAFIHSGSDYGENMFWGSGKDWRPADAVNDWTQEKKFYSHRKNSCIMNQNCYHYTQVVWKESSYVGCAKVICNSGDTLIQCNYNPHGNVVGQKPF